MKSVESQSRFGGICSFHLKGKRINRARDQHRILRSGAGSTKPSRDFKTITMQLRTVFEEGIGKGYCNLESMLFKCVLNDFTQLPQVKFNSLDMQTNAVNLTIHSLHWSENVSLYSVKYFE